MTLFQQQQSTSSLTNNLHKQITELISRLENMPWTMDVSLTNRAPLVTDNGIFQILENYNGIFQKSRTSNQDYIIWNHYSENTVHVIRPTEQKNTPKLCSFENENVEK